MNRQYLEYIPEVGIPAANSHHGQQHHLHKKPECKAASLSNFHDTQACSSWADHVSGSNRCWLKGAIGDALHALSCAVDYNVRWLMRAVVSLVLKGLLLAFVLVRWVAALTAPRAVSEPRAVHTALAPT